LNDLDKNFEKCSNIKFIKISPVEAKLFNEERQTDMTKHMHKPLCF